MTFLMLLAVLYLCAWDYPRVRGIFVPPGAAPAPQAPRFELDGLERVGFVVFGVSLLAFFGLTRGFGPVGMGVPLLIVGLLAGLFTLGSFLTTGRRLVPAAGAAGPG